MKNKEIRRIFEEIADLLEITGQDRFRVNSYRRAARTIGDLQGDIADVATEGGLTKISGIGKQTAERIEQYLSEGKIDVHEELRKATPEGLPELLAIQGMGPKKVKLVWEKLGVEGMDDLEEAIKSGELQELPGLGAKSAAQIREGIEFLKRNSGRTPLGVALPIARSLADRLAELPSVKDVSIAGSLRRGVETIGDVDILVSSGDGKDVIDAFLAFPEVRKSLAAGSTKGSALVGDKEIQVDVRVVESKSFGAALQYFSGSKEHNVRLRELAQNRGWRLNEYGLYDGEKQIAGKKEDEIYEKLGLAPIPPEIREDRGEIEAARSPFALITQGDMRGELHTHTTESDGKATAEEMVAAAEYLGYDYVAISDHGPTSVIANGLDIDRKIAQLEHIRNLAKETKGIKVLTGAEVNILSDGSLDYPDDLLAEIDVVVASAHVALGQERKIVTRRTIKAIENPHVDVLGHPTGRLLNTREGMDLDIDAVIQAAVETNTALEINAAWQRLDLKDLHVRAAYDAGSYIAINTDAHSVEDYDQIGYGVATARRGWVTKDRVINTWTINSLMKWLANR